MCCSMQDRSPPGPGLDTPGLTEWCVDKCSMYALSWTGGWMRGNMLRNEANTNTTDAMTHFQVLFHAALSTAATRPLISVPVVGEDGTCLDSLTHSLGYRWLTQTVGVFQGQQGITSLWCDRHRAVRRDRHTGWWGWLSASPWLSQWELWGDRLPQTGRWPH